jgi:hypothetical protein
VVVWASGQPAVCKTVHTGSNPVITSNVPNQLQILKGNDAMKMTELQGAEIALRALELKGRLEDDGWFAGDYELSTTFRDWDYDPQNVQANENGIVKIDPQFSTWVDCSDTFMWGSADAEELTEENFGILMKTIHDLKPLVSAAQVLDQEATGRNHELYKQAYAAYQLAYPNKADRAFWDEHGNPKQYEVPKGEYTGRAQRLRRSVSDLFVARVRNMRPQGAAYKVRYPEEIWGLFNAAGPEREVGLGNPRHPGE